MRDLQPRCISRFFFFFHQGFAMYLRVVYLFGFFFWVVFVSPLLCTWKYLDFGLCHQCCFGFVLCLPVVDGKIYVGKISLGLFWFFLCSIFFEMQKLLSCFVQNCVSLIYLFCVQFSCKKIVKYILFQIFTFCYIFILNLNLSD